MTRRLILTAIAAVLALPAQAGAATSAERTLAEALALFRPPSASARPARAGSEHATLVLRDLALRLGELSPFDRRLATSLLARPTSARALNRYVVVSRRSCTSRFCVWWTTSGRDAPPARDTDGDGIPNQVEQTKRVLTNVWRREIGGMGYLRPLGDGSLRSPDDRLDIYLVDVGRHNVYGYCATDDPRRRLATARSVSVFCVFDDDFAAGQFPGSVSGLRGLRVTAAHEFFHAVQSRYDFREDRFLLEGTAVWMEDEVFDGINDNRRWLEYGPLMPENSTDIGPWVPLDVSTPDLSDPLYVYNYSSWIFFRFLAERVDRAIIRRIWERARKRRSTRAIVGSVEARGLPFRKVFADFGVWNSAPPSFYSEGSAYLPAGARAVDLDVPVTVDMYHLANDYLEVPVAGSGATTLTLTLDLPAGDQPGEPEANVLVWTPLGLARTEVALDPTGNGTATIPVAGATRAVVVLTNAGSDAVCDQGTVYACEGQSLDDAMNGYVVLASLS